MRTGNRIKVGLVQVNNSFGNQHYLPYSVGILQAYAQKYLKDPERFEFMIPIFSRISVQTAVKQLVTADIVCFSTYVWNMRVSCAIAQELKKLRPEILIVFGGPQVPNQDLAFLKKFPYIDISIHGEGEPAFLALLENIEERNWAAVPSCRYIDSRGDVISTPKAPRISDINTIPSPYLTGVFKPIFEAYPKDFWLMSWETNRGCPFSCAYCDWGSATQSKVNKFDLDRLYKEMDWMADNKIQFVFCCDANFGIFPRDIDIAQYAAQTKKRSGFPEALSVQNTKNSTDNSYLIQKILGEAGLNKGVTLAIQSMNPSALEAIKRKNIKLSVYQELQKKFAADKVETYSDYILGLPEETYDSFKEGVAALIENGQHYRIQFSNLSILPNAEINNAEYREKYGVITSFSKMINMHGSLVNDEVHEEQELVVATNTMPKEDWVKVRAASWMSALVYFDKLLQIPLLLIHEVSGVSFKELIEFFNDYPTQSPILKEIRAFFIENATKIQNGGEEYSESKEWLNIWWPADEYIFIKLTRENKLDAFYEETKKELKRFLKDKGLELPHALIDDAVTLNRELLKRPFETHDKVVSLRHNIFEVYRSFLLKETVPIETGTFDYHIDRSTKSWQSWDDWYKQVVWYGNKKGAYLYSCHLTTSAQPAGTAR